MKKLQVSKRAQKVIASPIRKFLPLLQKTEKKGVKVYKINVGDPDLPAPLPFYQTIKKYPPKTLGYAPSPGILQHTQAWQTYLKQFGADLPLQNIIPTVGGAEAILLAIMAVADPGDEILVFEPLYSSYKSFSVMMGIKAVPVTLRLENNFALPDIATIEKKITPRTKAVVVINPDNPTGKLWSRPELLTVIRLAKKYHLFIISDETYREIRFQGKPYSLLAERSARQNVILTDSLSKRFSMPGARLGCVASFNKEVMQSVLKFAQARLSVGTLEQWGTVPLLLHSKVYTQKVRQEYLKRRNAVALGLKKIKGAVFKPAQGAFYQAVRLPVDSTEDFVKFMINKFSYQKQTVMVTPMQDFYITPGLGKSEIRIAYVLKASDLKIAMDILRRGVEAYQQKRK